MKKQILFLCCLCLAAGAHAQSNYQKSRVVTATRDTLMGWVDYKEWQYNPVTVKFSDNPEGSNARTYTVKDILNLEIEGQDYFEQAVVSVSRDRVAPLESLSVGPDRRVSTDTVLLRLARKGAQLTLYSYEDRLKTRYYIRENKKGKLSELVYRRYFSPEPGLREKLITEKSYKEQLMAAGEGGKALNTAVLSELLSKTEYTLPAIARAVDFINGPDGRVFTPKGRARVQFYAGLALSSSRAFYSGVNDLVTGAHSKNAFMPKITAGIDLLINPFVRKQILRMDLSFAMANNKVSKPAGADGGYISHTFDQYTIAFCPQLIYNVYNSRKLRINAGAGISANYSLYRNSIYEQKYTLPGPGGKYDYEMPVAMEAFWFSIPLRAGITLHDRLDVYAQYAVLSSPVAIFNAYSVRVRTWQLGANFLLK